MDAKLVNSISSQVYRQFPEVQGCHPKVQLQASPQPKTNASSSTYLITYRGAATAVNGKSILRIVRVVANDQGKILKITTSR